MSFTFNNPNTTGNVVSRINVTNNVANAIPLNYSLNTGNLWIYCNYPETLPANSLAQNGACLNKVDVNAGTHQVFFSYQGYGGLANTTPLYFNILVVKKNTGAAISFTNLKEGIRTSHASPSAWSYVNAGSWVPYFSSSAKSPVVLNNQGDYGWLVKDFLKEGGAHLISGNVQFSVTGGATIYVFASTQQNFTNYTSLAPYPKPTTENGYYYSGYGVGYRYSATITLDAATLPSTTSPDKKFFLLNYPTDSRLANSTINSKPAPYNSDLIELTLNSGSGDRKINAGTPSQNMGNWGAMYEFTLKIFNSSSSTKNVNMYLQTDTTGKGEFPVIQYGNNVLWATDFLMGPDRACWKFLRASVNGNISSGNALSQTFCYILGTNSSHKKMMFFDIG